MSGICLATLAYLPVPFIEFLYFGRASMVQVGAAEMISVNVAVRKKMPQKSMTASENSAMESVNIAFRTLGTAALGKK